MGKKKSVSLYFEKGCSSENINKYLYKASFNCIGLHNECKSHFSIERENEFKFLKIFI